MTDLWDGPKPPKRPMSDAYHLANLFNSVSRKHLKRGMITTAAIFGATFVATVYAPPALSLAILNLGLIGKLFIERNHNAALKMAFNDLAKDFDAQTRQHLYPLENELSKVEEFSLKSINPVALWKKDPVPVSVAAVFGVFLPTFAAGIYAYAVNMQDSKQSALIAQASLQAAEDLLRNAPPPEPKNPAP